MKNVIKELEMRGFVDAMTSEELVEMADKPLTVYVGFDPTSDSLHLGNLIGIMGLAWFERFGHKPVAVVGGATGMIGDPSGKSVERNLLDEKTIEHNLAGIRRSIEAVLKNEVTILNNYDWFSGIGYIHFLRDVGKHFRLGTMLAKESVKTRLASEEGISYTEFSYQMLQAYDFYHLYQTHGVNVQMGGSDQWGNITAGTELVRKMSGKSVHGLTFPLLTRSDGKKFGKTEEGTVWLNPERLSPYDFYQYLFRLPDADMPKLLRMLTFLDLQEIEEIEASMEREEYVANTAQKRLAEEVTRIVHGEEGLEEARKVTEAARPGSHTALTEATLAQLPQKAIEEMVGMRAIDLIVSSGLLTSKGEARRMIKSGGVYINNEKLKDENTTVKDDDLIEGQFLLLGIGKKKKVVLRSV